MLKLALVFALGGVGVLARYVVAGSVQRLAGVPFPYGTLVVNVLGCLAIGYLGTLFFESWPVREEYRVAIIIGLLGGFTTFSTYAWESLNLAQGGAWGAALANLLVANVLAFAAVWVGHRLAAA